MVWLDCDEFIEVFVEYEYGLYVQYVVYEVQFDVDLVFCVVIEGLDVEVVGQCWQVCEQEVVYCECCEYLVVVVVFVFVVVQVVFGEQGGDGYYKSCDCDDGQLWM